jgi:6-phosphogluconate dehydrogenase
VWTVQTALDQGVPVSGIAEAVFARSLSSQSEQRKGKPNLPANNQSWNVTDKAAFVESVRRALYASKIVAYSQGFDAIRAGAKEFGWEINLGEVARIWRGGCIIRAQFLNRITDAYRNNPNLLSLLFDDYFVKAIDASLSAWREVVAMAALSGIPSPAFSSSLAHYDGLRAERLPAALVQGQRDFFGAHTYKRVDAPGTYHTRWSQDRTEVQTD